MIDYFALLDQPRAPWLEPDELKAAYHKKTLRAHPDAHTNRTSSDDTDASFASLNEAYQILQDPKRRLHHLLSLQNCAPSSANQTVPQNLHDLFPRVGALTERSRVLLEEIRAASNALSRSLLKPRILKMQNETKAVRETIGNLSDASLAELRQINRDWAENPAQQIEALSNLYFAFAYLTRWSGQLDEILFQLSLH
jgi:curved DNA-binding protein CbpA